MVAIKENCVSVQPQNPLKLVRFAPKIESPIKDVTIEENLARSCETDGHIADSSDVPFDTKINLILNKVEVVDDQPELIREIDLGDRVVMVRKEE